jgi:hypothetical protein
MIDGKIIMPRRHKDTKITEVWIISRRRIGTEISDHKSCSNTPEAYKSSNSLLQLNWRGT